MERLDETLFANDPRGAIERAQASGEAVEITKDGQLIALIVPVRAGRSRKPGGSKSIVRLANPADTLDDLLTAEDADAWYRTNANGVE